MRGGQRGARDVPVRKPGAEETHQGHTGICGTDLHIEADSSCARRWSCHEYCGTIAEVGGRRDWSVGDMVVGRHNRRPRRVRACRAMPTSAIRSSPGQRHNGALPSTSPCRHGWHIPARRHPWEVAGSPGRSPSAHCLVERAMTAGQSVLFSGAATIA